MAQRKGSAGGAAYQNKIAAWIAVEMLAERRPAEPLTNVGQVAFVRAETQEDVDDVLIGSSVDRYTFVQARRRISLSESPKADFASVIDQAVRQVLGSRLRNGKQPWSRGLVDGALLGYRNHWTVH